MTDEPVTEALRSAPDAHKALLAALAIPWEDHGTTYSVEWVRHSVWHKMVVKDGVARLPTETEVALIDRFAHLLRVADEIRSAGQALDDAGWPQDTE